MLFVTFNNQKFKIFWLILKSKGENLKFTLTHTFVADYLLVLESFERWEEIRQEKGLLISTMRPYRGRRYCCVQSNKTLNPGKS